MPPPPPPPLIAEDDGDGGDGEGDGSGDSDKDGVGRLLPAFTLGDDTDISPAEAAFKGTTFLF